METRSGKKIAYVAPKTKTKTAPKTETATEAKTETATEAKPKMVYQVDVYICNPPAGIRVFNNCYVSHFYKWISSDLSAEDVKRQFIGDRPILTRADLISQGDDDVFEQKRLPIDAVCAPVTAAGLRMLNMNQSPIYALEDALEKFEKRYARVSSQYIENLKTLEEDMKREPREQREPETCKRAREHRKTETEEQRETETCKRVRVQ